MPALNIILSRAYYHPCNNCKRIDWGGEKNNTKVETNWEFINIFSLNAKGWATVKNYWIYFLILKIFSNYILKIIQNFYKFTRKLKSCPPLINFYLSFSHCTYPSQSVWIICILLLHDHHMRYLKSQEKISCFLALS